MPRPPDRRHAARARAWPCAAPAPPRPWRRRPHRQECRYRPRRGPARDRVQSLHVPPSDPAAALPAIAAAPPEVRPPPATAASAPCRNRPATRRARLPDCRHREQARGRAHRISSLLIARSSSIARTICRSLAVSVRSLRGSSRRATCMVMVDAPETISPMKRPLPGGPGHGDRVNSAMGPETLVLIRDQHGEVARIDLLDVRLQTPAPLRRRVGTQQNAVAVDHLDRVSQCIGARQRRQRAHPQAEGEHAASDSAPPAQAAIASRRFICRSSPRSCRSRCGRTGRGGTCPRRTPADGHSCPAPPRARHRRP